MLLGLVSAKGAPGVTAASVALTAASGGLMVELDPSGGSLDCWLRATGEPGLIRAASMLRRQADPATLASCATEVVPGVRAFRAPTSGVLAETTIVALRDRLLPSLSEFDVTLIVDGGRWARSQPTARRLAGCDAVVLVCAPTIEGVEAARWQIEQLEALVERVLLVPVGDRPYGPAEVAAATDAEVCGALAWDRSGLARLLDRGAGNGWHRTSLARSARQLLEGLGVHRPTTPSSGASDTGVVAGSGFESEATHA
ncbi:MAG TPA: hypothetical protein PLV68_01770 [Ilumatobacteraceae bacterium]|nr:hypothetical protein [Ilumatobacteraceae bacterium]